MTGRAGIILPGWVERAVYVSLLLLSSDAPRPPPIGELEVEPLARSVPLAFPVRGEWVVLTGRHVRQPTMQRTVHLMMVDKQGSRYRGDGLDNRDYYAYGQPILAMAAGEVVTAVDGVPDSEPGKVASNFLLGNVVVIRHADGQHAVYGHLSPGSATVSVGDHVDAGQVIGACGSSGRTEAPLLHVHVQDAPDFGRAWGVEAVFTGVIERDGERSQVEGILLEDDDIVVGPA